MNYLEDIEKRIDDYLLERMSIDDRQKFELDLKSDPELRKQFLAQKEVVDSIQREALRDFLIECEEQRKTMSHVVFTGGFRELISVLRHYVVSRRFVSIGLSIVASLVIVIGGIRYQNVANSLQELSVFAFEQAISPIVRGEVDNSDKLYQIRTSIGDKRYTNALRQIEELEHLLNSQEVTFGNATEEDEYKNSLLNLQRQEVTWYKAIVLMGQRKVFKAKKILKSIASEGGIYADDAQKIIEKAY